MSFDELLIQTCTVYSHTTTTDDLGDASATWSSIAASVPCRVQPVSASYKSIQGNNVELLKYAKPQYKLYVKVQSGVTILQGHKVTVSELSQSFTVNFAKKDSSGHHWELECEEFDFIQ